MHDSFETVSNDDATEDLKLDKQKDTSSSIKTNSTSQSQKQSEGGDADRNGTEKRKESKDMGFQTQQHSGSLNGGNDSDLVKAGSTSDEEDGASTSDAPKAKQSTNGDDGGALSKPKEGTGAASEDGKGGGSGGMDGEGGDGGDDGVGEEKKSSTSSTSGNPAANGAQAKAPAASPPPPVLRGTLSYNIDLKRHLIRGMWNYENSHALPPQRFELLRNLDPGEDPTVLPKDGEFHGSFSLAYFHTTSKGRQKERSKVIPESGVKIVFTKIEKEPGSFKVDGKGTNQFGIFHINGTATPSPHEDDPTFNVVLRKRYEPSAPAAGAPATESAPPPGGKKSKKRKMGSNGGDGSDDDGNPDDGPLPPPSQSYEKNVVCLRGKLYKETEEVVGVGEHIHRINGMWSPGLDLILADPQNVRGLCNRFEYEHKGSGSSTKFPISGRYSGWFDLSQEDGSRKRISERDITLRFRKNDAGYHNVEGKGSNAFGKYSITGTLTADHIITIFRHFQPRKIKPPKPVTSAPPPINAPGQTRRPSLPVAPEPQLKLGEVKVADNSEDAELEPIKPPEHPTYSAVSRGILRLNEDGSHSCQGKWAVTREHFTNGQTSNFNFRLEAHFVTDATKNTPEGRQFPLDSEMYKGSFQLKKGGTRYQTVVDQQIVMKFRKNTAGSYNVYGKGINGIGVFNLTGTLIMQGKTGGNVELYRMYPPELLGSQPSAPKAPGSTALPAALPKPFKPSDPIPSSDSMAAPPSLAPSSSTMLPGPPRAGIVRRESTRLVKLPSRLEDDDPKAQLARIMDKCNHILRTMREKDIELGAFFSEPVDPVALGIPTYSTVIKEPMDLRTIHKKMEAQEIESPEEFARLTRLVFENAMTFNVDPTHSVHQAARSLITIFNQKFRDAERLIQTLRRTQKGSDDDKRKKGKDDKKRKRGSEEPKSLKRMRLEEAQDMASDNNEALAAIIAAGAEQSPGGGVSRTEFSMMLQMIQQLQRQVVQTFTALAELSSDDVDSGAAVTSMDYIPSDVMSVEIPTPMVQEKKKPVKKKVEPPKPIEKPVVIEDDSRPLTLKEQELLTDTINELPPDHLPGVIQIIREAAQLTGDEDEIDLEIDLLDTATQRKLLRHVSKFIKQPKRPKTKAPKKTKPAPASPPTKKAEKSSPAPASKPAAKTAPAKPKTDPDSFLSFGSKGEDSDTDESDDGEISSPPPAPAPAPAPGSASPEPAPAPAPKDGFNLGGGFAGFHDDDDDEDDDDEEDEEGGGGLAANWNIAKPSADSSKKDDDDDDGWGAAREEAAAAKAREADKKAREEKMKAEAEMAKQQRMADAAARGEELKAQRAEEEEKEAQLREQQEKEAEEQRLAAREAARAQVKSVEQTVDLDAQRDIMKQYEQSFLDKEGGASPSSDFGF